MVEREASLPPDSPKRCSVCSEVKTLADFYRGTYACIPCFVERQNRQREAKRVEKKQLREQQAPARAAKSKEKRKAYRKGYYAKNRDTVIQKSRTYRSENLEACRARELAYQKTPKGAMVAKNTTHRRRAAKRQGSVTTDQLLALSAKANGCCYYCRGKFKKLTIDHIVPLSKGGRHDLDNLVMACGPCNLKKTDRDPIEFARSIGVLLV